MEFLMEAFERIIKQYNYKFNLTKYTNNTYGLDFFDLPPELDYALICLSYDETIETTEPIKNVYGRNGETNKVLKTKKIDICTPINGGKLGNIVHVDFCEKDYAIKINKIQVCLRTYFEKHAF